MKNSIYYQEKHKAQMIKLKELKAKLPPYAVSFLNDKELTSQISTTVSYARDLITFFEYLQESNPALAGKDIKSIPDEILEYLSFEDINEYQRYLQYNDGEFHHENEEKGIARRMSALRGFFTFACTHGYLKNNPTVGAAKRRKQPKKDIVRLNDKDINTFLDTIENSSLASERQRKLCEKTALRDTAILTLLLNTGIRVSECVGLDVNDVNFKDCTITIVRKGGDTALLYFNTAVESALGDYIREERPKYLPDDNYKALFLSNRKQRMTVRSVQKMVEKYAKEALPDKHLSPHKMRSTYGTALYRETGDIRLVADVLGHKDINTTAKHYAAIEEEHRQRAAGIETYKRTK